MRSNANAILFLGALALGGCSGGWWHDPPTVPAGDAAGPAPVSAGYPDTPRVSVDPSPSGQDWASGGAGYPPPAATPEPPRRLRPGPRATPQPDDGPPPPQMPTVRYDNVGYAVWSNAPGTVAAAHPSLPPGSFAEVTALDTGKTIIVPITATARGGQEIELSGAAAQELGLGAGGHAGVRVRAINASGMDMAALRAGRPAPARPDTPPVLLNALRRKLAGTSGQSGTDSMPPITHPQPAAPPVAATPRQPVPAARVPADGPGYYVQVAAVSDPARARQVARSIGGSVSSAGGLHRIRLGPFKDPRAAQAARDDVATRGYGEARIVRED